MIMAKVLVTGSAGFMGSWLQDELLAQGHEVVGVDNFLGGYERNVNPDCDFRKGDLRDSKVCEEAVKGVDVIYHLAAYAAEGQSVFSFDMINDINIGSSNRLLTAAINEGVPKLVFTSSMAVYGEAKPPMDETLPKKPVDPYGWGKAYFEGVLESCSNAFDLDFTIIRPHNVYGPRQNIADFSRNVVGIFMNRIMNNKAPYIYGDGEQTRAFSYVEDAIPAIARAGFEKRARNQIINVGSDEVVTVNQLAEIVLQVMGSNLKPVHVEERPNEVKHAWCTTKKAEDILTYKTNHSLREGVEKMAEWAKEVGPQEVKYNLPLQITKNAPKVWVERLL
ncbi:MAG: NAD-dependent epimerase/dehydratase family protein [Candidatus Diapherotrites archaeon]|nr:NAD-dependent epimerase/dehydratase family protein [Candidatus Diapherotrites archaeon]